MTAKMQRDMTWSEKNAHHLEISRKRLAAFPIFHEQAQPTPANAAAMVHDHIDNSISLRH